MVELNYSNQNLGVSSEGILSAILMSCAFVVSIFFGIKLRWLKFNYRMTLPKEAPVTPVVLRTSSLTEVRENCAIGRYSYVENDEVVSMSNYTTPTPPPPLSVASSSSSDVKSKNSTTTSDSIFKWPFKSKMNLSKKHSFNHENYSNVHRPTSTERRERDLAMMEKNERIKRSIHEKLFASASMPDLLRQDESPKVEQKVEIKIHKGIEVTDESAQFVTVDEIKPPKRPLRAKVRRAPDPPVQKSTPLEVEEEEIKPKPPTPPIRRQSRSNSLRASQIEFNSQLPPLVMPRRNFNQNYLTIDSVDSSVVPEEEPPLKSILKTGNEENHSHKTQHITFVNVPDSSSEDEEEQQSDVWTQIDIHRDQLKRYQEIEIEGVSRFDESDEEYDCTGAWSANCESDSDDEEVLPPPLPRTPPPLSDEQPFLREFIIA